MLAFQNLAHALSLAHGNKSCTIPYVLISLVSGNLLPSMQYFRRQVNALRYSITNYFTFVGQWFYKKGNKNLARIDSLSNKEIFYHSKTLQQYHLHTEKKTRILPYFVIYIPRFWKSFTIYDIFPKKGERPLLFIFQRMQGSAFATSFDLRAIFTLYVHSLQCLLYMFTGPFSVQLLEYSCHGELPHLVKRKIDLHLSL